MKMKVETILEYRCGHPSQSLLTCSVNPNSRDLHQQLVEICNRIPKRDDGKIECRCPKCNRGAGWLVMKLDGVTVARDCIDEVYRAGGLRDADVSLGPDVEEN